MNDKKILVIDDEEFIRINLNDIFSQEGYKTDLVDSGKVGLQSIKENNYDLAFLDINLPDINGIEVLKEIKNIEPDLLVIVITGFASVESAVDAIKLGAYDYIKKPFKADAIKLITKLAFETIQLKRKVQKLELQQKELQGIDSIIGESEVIKKLKEQIVDYSAHDSGTVLITGESGCGKELIASAIHNLSKRSDKAFVEINCASIPENLLESELFGYEKGAFTDAKNKKTGLLEISDGGTLFLDEIGEMSLSLQAKLLRVLENKKIRRLGSTKDINIDLRIIAATNKDLSEAIKRSEFREDLYYRLNVLRVSVPPLRERGEDILLLAKYFVNHFNTRFAKKIMGFSESANKAILSYDWPGNVRELKNVIERTCILQKKSIIDMEDIAGEFINKPNEIGITIGDSQFDLSTNSYEEILTEIDKKLILKSLELAEGNTSKAARILKIPRETLRYKLIKFNISNITQ